MRCTLWPEVARSAAADDHHVRAGVDGFGGRRRLPRRVLRLQCRPDEHATATAAGTGTPGPARSSWRSEAAVRVVLPELAAGAAPPSRGCPGVGGGGQLPARRLDAADREAGRDPGHHPVVEVTCQRDGPRPRRAGQGVPHPPAGCRALPFVATDALVLKVREGGRTVNVDGHKEVLGLHVTSTEDGAGWLGFFRDLVARGLTGSRWSPATRTAAWSRRSAPPCPARSGNAGGRTTRRT